VTFAPGDRVWVRSETESHNYRATVRHGTARRCLETGGAGR
jgi:hypothetical protein